MNTNNAFSQNYTVPAKRVYCNYRLTAYQKWSKQQKRGVIRLYVGSQHLNDTDIITF